MGGSLRFIGGEVGWARRWALWVGVVVWMFLLLLLLLLVVDFCELDC